MTVSRVINGRSGVAPMTRTIVEDAIRALGYTPNVAARSLVTSSELRIGVIYSNPSAAFMSDFLTGVFEEASIRGARLILLKGEEGRAPEESAVDDLIAAGVSGVILTPPLGESPALLQVLRARTPADVALKVRGSLPPGWLPPQMRIEASAMAPDLLMVKPLNDRLLGRPLEESGILYWHGDLL